MGRLNDTWRVLLAVASGSFVVVLNQTIMNVALPRIMAVFGAGIDQAQLVLTGFMLATAVIMPATPFLSARLGSRRLFIATIGLFTLGSILCGLAWNLPSLIVARVLQGLGGGMIQPLGMAMLFRVTPPHERGTVMGLYAMPIMLGPILGPTVGGYLVEYADWRWVFFLNGPVGLMAIGLGLLFLRETPLVADLRFDYVGFVLAAACSSGALIGLSLAASRGWSDMTVVIGLSLAAVTLPLFIAWELLTPQPLLNLRLFAIPAFAVGGVINFVGMITLFGVMFLMPVFLQNLRGLGPMQTGLMMVPQALASTVSIIVGGRLYDRVGPRPLIISGLLVTAVSTWPLINLDITTPDSTLVFLLTVRGIATGLLIMPAITAWMASAPASQTAAASALNNVLRQLYSTFATAIFASLLQARLTFHQASLAATVVPDSPAISRLLAQGQQFALEHGLSLQQGKSLVVGQLLGQVRQTATIRGFDDCFLVATIICIIGIGPALLVSRPPRQEPPRPLQPSPAPATTHTTTSRAPQSIRA